MLYLVKRIENQISLLEYESDTKSFVTIKKNGEAWQVFEEKVFWQWFKKKLDDENKPLSFALISDTEAFAIDPELTLAKSHFAEENKKVLKLLENQKKRGEKLYFIPPFDYKKREVFREAQQSFDSIKTSLKEKQVKSIPFFKKTVRSLQSLKNAMVRIDFTNSKKVLMWFPKIAIFTIKKLKQMKEHREYELEKTRNTFDDVFLMVKPLFKEKIVFMKKNYFYYKKYNLCLYIHDDLMKKMNQNNVYNNALIISDSIESMIENMRSVIQELEGNVVEFVKNDFEDTSLDKKLMALILLWLDGSEKLLKLDKAVLKSTEKTLLRRIKRELYQLWIIDKLLFVVYILEKRFDKKILVKSRRYLEEKYLEFGIGENRKKEVWSQEQENHLFLSQGRGRHFDIDVFRLNRAEVVTLDMLFMLVKTKKLYYSAQKLNAREHFSLTLTYGCKLKMIKDKSYIKLYKSMLKKES